MDMEENFLNLLKGIYEKPITNIVLNDEILTICSLKRSGTK